MYISHAQAKKTHWLLLKWAFGLSLAVFVLRPQAELKSALCGYYMIINSQVNPGGNPGESQLTSRVVQNGPVIVACLQSSDHSRMFFSAYTSEPQGVEEPEMFRLE